MGNILHGMHYTCLTEVVLARMRRIPLMIRSKVYPKSKKSCVGCTRYVQQRVY